MNIFFLAGDPEQCARMHCDKHVVKMILEYAQLMSTAHRVVDKSTNDTLYKTTHVNHPCSVWIRQSANNYAWVYSLWVALCQEYTYRYGKTHASELRLKETLSKVPENLIPKGFTLPAQAMPDEHKNKDVVTAYRNYYNAVKRGIATWKLREVPTWFSNGGVVA